ncbi:MAG TPA: elongation factor G [Thermoclostridium caenicola]|uniref:elongation factor G n=1 Tax=Thermoclostridium caenicola TaxID=659425 RepID=UPI002CDF920A|nr:elongation factor G [Thermoclostridium caenicola]HOK42597.1 elongation factor G [Thermoclostridium caenicola]HOL84113.1 elongation factor G [Thermoclostridium caenicola]HPO76202.1 elongation factor G [Thermoclostridium caenicola]
MKDYSADKVRNVCLLGHGGSGKTTLAEAMLFISGGTDRFGSVVDGNTVMDFDAEEIKRKISISTALAPVEWKGMKINVIDTPGYFDFAGEMLEGLAVADGAAILVGAKDGLQVGTEKAWEAVEQKKLPRMFVISKLDEENSDFSKVFDQLKDKFGKSVIALQIPYVENGKVAGIINVPKMKVVTFNGKEYQEKDVPDNLKGEVESYKEGIFEAVAETSEELMEKYFAGEPFTDEEVAQGIKLGVKAGEITPVLCTTAVQKLGVRLFLDAVLDYIPAHIEKETVSARNSNNEPVTLKTSESEALAVQVFKTIVDPFVGKISFLKVISGTLSADTTVYNPKKDKTEKIGNLFVMKGKQQLNVSKLACGDIGAVAKLTVTETNDTLCTKEKPVILEEIKFPQPMLGMAVMPKAKGDEEKIGSGLQRLLEEDPTFKMELNAETKQTLIYGLGDQHLDVITSKLKNKFKVDVELVTPKTPYRETIRKKVRVEGKHKKQSGGHGQFGVVVIEFEPGESEDLTFEEKIFGGAVPKQYFPAVEKGLRESMQKGVLAGYPVVNLKATLVDGKYHEVDSSEMAFKIAASLAYKEGMKQANPVLLEPICHVEVVVPDSYMGDIIGDLNKRRGRVLGMNPYGNGLQQVVAEVPQAEMLRYATDLRSITQGRGSYTMKFERYEEAPPHVAEKVIAEAARENADEE